MNESHKGSKKGLDINQNNQAKKANKTSHTDTGKKPISQQVENNELVKKIGSMGRTKACSLY